MLFVWSVEDRAPLRRRFVPGVRQKVVMLFLPIQYRLLDNLPESSLLILAANLVGHQGNSHLSEALMDCAGIMALLKEDFLESDWKGENMSTLRENLVKHLATRYLEDPLEVSRVCDEKLDRSGALLGEVRDEALKLKEEPGD